MSDIAVRRNHGMTLKKARAAGEQIAAELAEEFDFTYEWTGNTLNFKRMGVTGSIVVGKKALEINAQIGFLLRPIKSRIEREIHRFCDEKFGPADSGG
jgi:putative polyhydroxyalkanoate system protein